MKGQDKLIAGLVVGAGAMYLLDPDRGARRRSLLRDRGVRAGHKLSDGLAVTARDARNRTRGAAAELRSRFRREEPGDEVVEERIRSALGRVVSHPGAISVTVSQGQVTVSGPILAEEVDPLIKRIQSVRGVTEVRNQLELHDSPVGIPALQGGHSRGERSELMQENWAPATRLLVGSLGGLLAVEGVRTKGSAGSALSLLGLGILARAVANQPAARLVKIGKDHHGIDIHKTMTVAAPVDRVWQLWTNFESFPRFMSHLREVRKIDEGRSHWVASGPAGVPIEWDAEITDWVPEHLISWKSVEPSTIETAGSVRFRDLPGEQTKVDVQLSYAPPAGAVGHAVAALFGDDPKRAMDEDMVRLKSLLEEGRTRSEGDPVRLEELASASEPKRTKSAGRRKKPTQSDGE